MRANKSIVFLCIVSVFVILWSWALKYDVPGRVYTAWFITTIAVGIYNIVQWLDKEEKAKKQDRE